MSFGVVVDALTAGVGVGVGDWGAGENCAGRGESEEIRIAGILRKGGTGSGGTAATVDGEKCGLAGDGGSGMVEACSSNEAGESSSPADAGGPSWSSRQAPEAGPDAAETWSWGVGRGGVNDAASTATNC